MLIRKQLGLVVATLVLVIGSQANAQGPGPGGPGGMGGPGSVGSSMLGQDNFTHDSFGASFDPANLDYDMAPFAPLDVSDYGSKRKARAGFVARYDRSYMSLSRPTAAGNIASPQVPIGNDWVSGNKIRLGFTNDAGNGWEMDYLKSAGGFYSNGSGIDALSPVFTDTKVHNVQFNRVFRSDLSRGGLLEPYVGAGYFSVADNSTQAGLITLLNPNDPNDPLDDTLESANFRFRQKGGNSAAGGQLGVRYSTQQGRWGMESNFNIAGFYNSQSGSATTTAIFPTTQTQAGASSVRGNENSFVPMVNLSLATSYGITRDISFRMGAQLMHAWDGVHRVNTLPANANPNANFLRPGFVTMTTEDLTLAGFTFGIEWKR